MQVVVKTSILGIATPPNIVYNFDSTNCPIRQKQKCTFKNSVGKHYCRDMSEMFISIVICEVE